ncbi:MAG: serine--tRNA ligase [Anaerolineae bacterium]|nr:serine--tRNA ligase [Anaerolineae bacterium]
MGRFRGNKALAPDVQAAVAAQAVSAIRDGDYGQALELLTTPPPLPGVDDPNALNALTDALRGMGARVDELGAQISEIEAQLRENMLWLPNLLDPAVPEGRTGEDNLTHPPVGQKRTFDFTPRPHWDIGPALDVIDFEAGVKLAGTRFYVLKGMGARLQRALINLCLDTHTTQHGFTELYLPFLVKEEMMEGAAQFPKFRNEVYQDADAGLYLLPTAEVAITNVHRDDILDADRLPLYYVANSPCWRREATSAGRDVRGIKRVHQFQKVEMYKFVRPETSQAELESLVQAAETICRMLAIPFRRVELCGGDMGFGMARTFDLEMWAPGCDEWLEVSSCSNAESFQARRAGVRYRPAPGAKPEFVHTLNGSGLAMPRVIIAILENYQRADGSVVIPDVLRPYMGGLEVIEPRR